MRTKTTITLKHPEQFKQNILSWAQPYKSVVWLDSNHYNTSTSTYDAVLAVDEASSLKSDETNAFDKLKAYQTEVNDWIFGYLTYDLKNDVEELQSKHFDGLKFPELYFFQPKKLFLFKGNQLEIQYLKEIEFEIEPDLNTIRHYQNGQLGKLNNAIKIKLRIHRDEYLKKVNKVLEHIYRGDIYEANFCQEFYAENVDINPLSIYNNLNNISKAPFATYLKIEDKYLLSASPERYIKKEGLKITSQPIKGTAKRSRNREEDEQLKLSLSQNEKERSENIMIVDLVRNDLSQTATKGSVIAEELCKVYSFEQVHQMISTVSSKVNKETHPVDIIKTTFPMGSMTGAPKISAMKIIESLEKTKRGLYSGTVGYFSPDNNFDFNVIIRSILYNATEKYVSYSVGGAITAKSNPLSEYEECLIKAKAMRQVLED